LEKERKNLTNGETLRKPRKKKEGSKPSFFDYIIFSSIIFS